MEPVELEKNDHIMETIILYCKTREEALHAVNDMCMDIKALPEDDQHILYMNRRIFGMYAIFPGVKLEDGDEPGRREKVQPGDRELIFFPAEKEEAFEKLKAGKNLILVKNCNYVIGESKVKKIRRSVIIDWLLGKGEFDPNLSLSMKIDKLIQAIIDESPLDNS